jgi:hypothetical protein
VESFYADFVKNLEIKERQIFDEELYLKLHAGKGFDIIEFSELKKVERKIREYDFESFLDDLIDHYDLVLWDLPEVDVLDSNKELYFPVVRVLDNVSFIVGGQKSKYRELNNLISYFKRYQVAIKGLLFAGEADKESK